VFLFGGMTEGGSRFDAAVMQMPECLSFKIAVDGKFSLLRQLPYGGLVVLGQEVRSK